MALDVTYDGEFTVTPTIADEHVDSVVDRLESSFEIRRGKHRSLIVPGTVREYHEYPLSEVFAHLRSLGYAIAGAMDYSDDDLEGPSEGKIGLDGRLYLAASSVPVYAGGETASGNATVVTKLIADIESAGNADTRSLSESLRRLRIELGLIEEPKAAVA